MSHIIKPSDINSLDINISEAQQLIEGLQRFRKNKPAHVQACIHDTINAIQACIKNYQAFNK